MSFSYNLIDLTHMLDSNIPTWNGGCGFNIEPKYWLQLLWKSESDVLPFCLW